MRRPSPLLGAARRMRLQHPATFVCRQCRAIQISAAPSTDGPRVGGDAFGAPIETARDMADARFEVLGAPYSMLSVTLSASQKLYTRRGTLVAVAGKPDNAQSTLSLLNPLSRAFFGVPFLYQRISATTPITALISTKSPTTTFTVLHLDGTTDWMVSQRNALLAWTGHTLSLSSRIQRSLSVAHWGSTHLTGRGLAALSAPGQIYQLTLAEGEEFVAHPGSVVAYAVSRNAPQPFRFKSSSLRLQVPSLTSWIPESEFLKNMRKTDTYKFLARTLFNLRTTARRTIWGDRLFLQFKGPATLLMSSRGVRVADVLSSEQVNEIADAPAGVLPQALELQGKDKTKEITDGAAAPATTTEQPPSALHVASVRRDGKVTFEDTKDLKEFVR
ncbi:altered inheritance of mitochondria protein 24, mitochondrial [Purpureocillium lilacinum]|uniref:altered inheritance of mitochondria protein 24, mitochondrial n=1 Tax=Purpureocillium lilacinum TaxID=33203 RepID=UPI0020862645|nr:altered inheritance of mitochondria protein 24, mitochondrial [Purpureocillium lilacinum]GJN82590.1 altered inheritance of mitochondria protein 24, mitochondrial [Purpureocillium lilacinum]